MTEMKRQDTQLLREHLVKCYTAATNGDREKTLHWVNIINEDMKGLEMID